MSAIHEESVDGKPSDPVDAVVARRRLGDAVGCVTSIGGGQLVNLEAANRPPTVTVHQTTHLGGAPRLHRLPDEAIDAEPLDEQKVRLFIASEELRADHQVWPDLSCFIQKIFGNVHRG
jgi:hypothetical protein